MILISISFGIAGASTGSGISKVIIPLDFIFEEEEIIIWLFIFTFFSEMIDCILFLEIELTFSFKNLSILLLRSLLVTEMVI